MDIQLEHDGIRLGPGLRIEFQRTLRIPDDGRTHPLPPGFGPFPLRRVDDYRERVPSDWLEHGGVLLPMYQREALWILLHGESWKPRALKVGVGKVCALTGQPWSESLHATPQDYLVTPPQPWLDGIALRKGLIRQFVAMPLGMGYTVEGQVTGEERFGGIQLKVFEPKPGRFPDEPPQVEFFRGALCMEPAGAAPAASRGRSASMGLGAGGRMKQKVYPDPHGIETWDEHATARSFVHIVNSELWREITGEQAPATPVTAREYEAAGLPWFDLYDEALGGTEGSDALRAVKSIKEKDAEKWTVPLQDDEPVKIGPVKKLASAARSLVRDGRW